MKPETKETIAGLVLDIATIAVINALLLMIASQALDQLFQPVMP